MRVGPVAETFEYFNFHWNLHKIGIQIIHSRSIFTLFFWGGGGGGGLYFFFPGFGAYMTGQYKAGQSSVKEKCTK